MQEVTQLYKLVSNLLLVKENEWGLYAFSKEPLHKKITKEEKKEMIDMAINCGIEYAKRIKMQYKSARVKELAEVFQIKVFQQDSSMIGKRIVFALYTPPNRIEIMNEPIQKACDILEKDSFLVEHFTQEVIINTILGHEIFHFLEEQFEQEIYTRTKKILLWSCLGIKNYSTIRTLSEIGAMAFTKELNQLTFSPYILDIILYYSYDSCSTKKIYHDIMKISARR
ncbi:hypothetical protein [Candidatus Galacturonibacter soehngenii]|uniref:Uncharacterized protein n=1 Tax=Candidatus Galacturonatibacter soehngenii TaxID=2307010 RepID=A0A7V7QIM1_9FIRM|nr:hypothetical protein [Candidatus Galacturonibacter soehngenii]KAB1436048.1 hypothetical protein F7O84_16910 [Candidatus Galacturonibacter soehngenii]